MTSKRGKNISDELDCALLLPLFVSTNILTSFASSYGTDTWEHLFVK